MCVAGYSSSKNEILELRLPPKLFADENKVTTPFYRKTHRGDVTSNPQCGVFRASAQSGTSKLSTVASRTVPFAASDTCQEPGGFLMRSSPAEGVSWGHVT